MLSVKELKQFKRLHVTSGTGFSLVIAILAILILTALGYLVVMMSTQDTRVSARVVGEKKAMAAAETGVHQLLANFNPADTASWNCTSRPYACGSTSDTTSTYTISEPRQPLPGSGIPASLPRPGFSLGVGGVDQMRMATVEGTSTKYNSTVNVQVGIGSFDYGGGPEIGIHN